MYKFLSVVLIPLYYVGYPLGVLFRPFYTGLMDGYYWMEDSSLEQYLKGEGFSDEDIDGIMIKRNH